MGIPWAKKRLPNTTVRLDRIAFQGGYNTETPPLEIPPGNVVDAENYEIQINGGYRRIPGYERYDGRDSPSAQSYYTLPADVTGAWVLGDTVTGGTSGETATVIGATDTGFLIANASGTFVDTEDLQISAASVGTCEGAQFIGGVPTSGDDAAYKNLAADVYRALISAVPGSGSVLGVHIYSGDIYAFRNNTGGTAAAMHKATSSGWSVVNLGYEVEFNTGSAAINVGDTVTGATSGGSGTVTGVAVRTGTWGGGNAVGILTFAGITSGPFQNGENLQVSAATKAVASADSIAITLSPGGRYQFQNYNFSGSSGSEKMYGCDSVNYGFEFDGTTYIPIRTGMVNDAPKFIAAHKKHLFFSFGASAQHSSTGDPYGWTPVTGAAEISVDDDITGFYPQVGSSQAGGALLITSRNSTHTLYGSSVSDWQLVETEHDAGALPYTLNKVGYSYMLDDRGIRRFGSSDVFGNFAQSTISLLIQEYLSGKKPLAVDSHVFGEKNQYRLFFSDRSALYVTISNNQVVGMMPIRLAHSLTCSASGELADGSEAAFFGANNGFVYQMEKGTSFDGDAISWRLNLAPHHIGTPDVKKRFHKCSLEVKAASYVAMQFSYELDYSSSDVQQPATDTVDRAFSSFVWDAFTWDDFFWDGRSLAPIPIKLQGRAPNIALICAGNSDEIAAHTVTGAVIHYSISKRKRS